MGKVFWHEPWECWARKIMLNGESVTVCSKNKEGLEKMTYRITGEILGKMNGDSPKA